MNTGVPTRRNVSVILVLPVVLFSSVVWGQVEGEQRLTEGVIVGPIIDNNNGDQGLFNPLFESLAGESDYTAFLPPAAGRDFKDVAIVPDGRTIVLDGNILRVYRRVFDPMTGQFIAVEDAAVNCTMLEFTTFKKNGTPQPGQTLSSCSSFTVLLDGTWRIAGRVGNGGGPEMIAHDPVLGSTALKASETPPEVSAIVGDLAEKTGAGQVYYWVGERKKIGKSFFDPVLQNLEPFEVISTLNGKRIDDLTLLGLNRLAVVTDAGELFQVNITTGAAEQFDTLLTGSDCGLGSKDPQAFSLSNLGGLIFVGNRGCNTITIYDDQDPPQQVQGLVNNPLKLETQDPPLVESLYPERLEVFAGRGGDFGFCGDSEATGCPLALEPNGGVMWGITNINPFPTVYREFEFVIDDCRLDVIPSPDCPIVNPGADREDWVLDLMQLWLQTEDGPLFKQLAFGDGPVERALLPSYLTAQTQVPSANATATSFPVDCNETPDDCILAGRKIISIVVVTDALFTDTFFVDYRLNEFLPTGADDKCDSLPFGSTVGEANEVYPPIVYHSTDGFGTVDRSASSDPGIAALEDRGGFLMTDLCNDRGTGPRWSSNTFNVEFTKSDPDALVLQAHRMVGELGQVVDNLICDSFEDPDGNPLPPLLDPSGSDCAALRNEMNQIFVKWDVCANALYFPQGNSEENCNALFTKTTNLQSRIDAADWPDPFNPATNLLVLKPNYQGELESRLAAFVFFMQEFVVKAASELPDSGEIPPQRWPPL
jgi:hypothetical protein